VSRGPEADARAEQAIKPELAEGDLVKVATASNQPEAEFIQGLLLNEGVPSVLRRTRGFDIPDFLAAGATGCARPGHPASRSPATCCHLVHLAGEPNALPTHYLFGAIPLPGPR